jgi:hypothetical protein
MLLIEDAGVCFPHSTQDKGILAFRTKILNTLRQNIEKGMPHMSTTKLDH